MKRFVPAVLCALLFATAVLAQQPVTNPDPASREQVVKMLEVMEARKQAKAMMDTMQAQMGQVMEEQLRKTAPDASPQMRAEMATAMQDMMKGMEPLINETMDQMIPIYQKYISRTEADAITAFYQSPEGQSFLHKMPLIMADAMPQMMKSMNEKMQTLIEQMGKRMDEIAKKYKDQQPSASK